MDEFIWGAEAIGKLIGRTERQVQYLHAQGALPTRKVGGRLMVSRQVLIETLRGEKRESTNA